MNAPPDSVDAPPPTPRTTTSTAPVDAPDEMPSTNGSASGLRSSDCMIAPQIARPAPQTAASSVRGRRSSHTMPSWMRVTPASPSAQVLADDREHVADREVGRADGDRDGDRQRPARPAPATQSATRAPGAPRAGRPGSRTVVALNREPEVAQGLSASFSVPSTVRIDGFMSAPLSTTYRLLAHRGQLLGDRVGLEERDLVGERVAGLLVAAQVAEHQDVRVAVEHASPS